MLVDHIGYLLLPDVVWLRWIGRLALPIFAYFVAEGCRHTRDRRRYVGRMLGLGCLCQLVYVAEELAGGGIRSVYLNILLTLTVAQLLCFAWLDFSAAVEAGERRAAFRAAGRFLLTVALAALLNQLDALLWPLCGVQVAFDYGLAGMLLPLAALVGKTPPTRMAAFGLGLLLFCAVLSASMSYAWWALLSLPLLLFYSGKRGDPRWQPVFYAFYPVHLAVLYGVNLLI